MKAVAHTGTDTASLVDIELPRPREAVLRRVADHDQLRALGAHVIELPTIRIEPPSNLREFAPAIERE